MSINNASLNTYPSPNYPIFPDLFENPISEAPSDLLFEDLLVDQKIKNFNSVEFSENANHPSHPSHPSQKPQKSDTVTIPAVTDEVTGDSLNPSHKLYPKHLDEWVNKSGVSEYITGLNIESLEDKKVIAKKLGWKKYDHTPGWFCSGVNPLTGEKLTNGIGQFRPDKEWENFKTGDKAKYITPKVGYDALCLDVGDPESWKRTIADISIELNITEGLKKAGAGLTHGYPTIALMGVWMGILNVTKDRKKTYRLVPTLRYFAQPGRVFNFCFDADIVRKKEVRDALRVLAKLLIDEGCVVKVTQWDESKGKGMDDYLVNNGKDDFDVEVARAQLIEEWEEQFEDEKEENKENKEKKELPEHSEIASLLKPRIGNLRFNDKIHKWEVYEDGYWSIASDESVFQAVTDQIEELYPNIGFAASYPAGAVKMLVARLLQKNLPEPPRNLLPFKNGVLNLDTKEILEHSPTYNFNSIIDREHDLKATDWSAISEWMDFVFQNNPSQKHLLLCWYAAVLRGMWELHRCALIVGEGGTGKSTAMKLGTGLVGRRSSHSLTLDSLNTRSFETGNIYDKRLVCVNDADRYHGTLEIFKNITGGDEINVEWKFEKAFNAVYKGLVMVTANNPVFTANDSGLDRRIILFKLDRKVAEIDPSFLEKLLAQMSAFTNYLLSIPEAEIIHTLLYKVDESGIRAENELEALLQTNAVADWLNSRYSYDPNSQLSIGSNKDDEKQLYGDYCSYCKRSGSSPRSSKEFSPEVIRLGRGALIKTKTRTGVIVQGLKRDDAGGFIETIISMKAQKTLADPASAPQNTQTPTSDDTQPISPLPHTLSQKMFQAWDSQWELGLIVLGASCQELKLATANYTPEQLKRVKDAANFCWQPQINQLADYAGDRVEVWEVNQSREIGIRTPSGTMQKIKRGNLRPWLGI